MSHVSRVSVAGSSNARQEIESAFKASMARMSPYVFNAPLLPDLEEHTGPKVSLFRGKVPTVISIERRDFEKNMAAEAQRMQRGSTYYLCAGTGVGKSTRIPLTLVKLKQALGIVVVPTIGIREHVSGYVKTLAGRGQFIGVNVSTAVSIRDIATANSRTVLFMTATDLLCVLAVDRNVFGSHHVGFLYIDEFHECIPQYFLLNWLIHASWFKDTVVLLGSATGSVRLEGRVSGDIPHSIETVRSELMAYEDLSALPYASPLHHGRMTNNRTMIFLPFESDFAAAKSYYIGNNVQAFTLEYGMSDKQLVKLSLQVLKAGTCVVLATQSFETAYTLPVNVVIDTGYTVDLLIDTSNMHVDYKLAEASDAQTTQRCGRVGRLEGGKAYKRDCAIFASPALTPGSEIYVALWMRVLGVTLREDSIDPWVEYLAKASYDKILSLLRSSVHPVIIRDYFGSGHVCLRYTDVVLDDVLAYNGNFKIMEEHFSVYTSMWRPQVLNLRIGTYDFKAVWLYGDEVKAIPAYLFFVMQHGKSISKSMANMAISGASSAMDEYGLKTSGRVSKNSYAMAPPRTPTSVRRLYEGSPSSKKYVDRDFDIEIPVGTSALSVASSSVAREVSAVRAIADDKRGTKEFAFDFGDSDGTRPPTFQTVESTYRARMRSKKEDDEFFSQPLSIADRSPRRGKVRDSRVSEPGSPRYTVTNSPKNQRVAAKAPGFDLDSFSYRLRKALHDYATGGDRSIPFGPSSEYNELVFVPVDVTTLTYKSKVALIPLNNEAALTYFLNKKELALLPQTTKYEGHEGGAAWVRTCVAWNSNVTKYMEYKTSNIADRALNRSPKWALMTNLSNLIAFSLHGVRFAEMPGLNSGFEKA